MTMTKWAALAVALVALAVVGCDMPQSAPVEMLVEAPRAMRAAAVAEPSITATKQDEARDHVTVTGPWAEGWYISGVYFDVGARKMPPNPLTGIKRNLTIRCDVGVSFQRGRGFVVVDLPQNKRRPEPDGFDLYVTVRRDGGYSRLDVEVCKP